MPQLGLNSDFKNVKLTQSSQLDVFVRLFVTDLIGDDTTFLENLDAFGAYLNPGSAPLTGLIIVKMGSVIATFPQYGMFMFSSCNGNDANVLDYA